MEDKIKWDDFDERMLKRFDSKGSFLELERKLNHLESITSIDIDDSYSSSRGEGESS
ncbi:hypothetical protein [Natranaerofaba carboxydovora]|uniref:hypothetical protein n=1 Tax=Natranaerofaba carboxydovora TaxID=2742683 RepID=UPI001F12B6A1|nr:hypothetical protein [Natranaerofaba carboxydovora]UMZ74706.1 hypothetical protein ACONDI_02306 [Natranaerofaba carboxydovora]